MAPVAIFEVDCDRAPSSQKHIRAQARSGLVVGPTWLSTCDPEKRPQGFELSYAAARGDSRDAGPGTGFATTRQPRGIRWPLGVTPTSVCSGIPGPETRSAAAADCNEPPTQRARRCRLLTGLTRSRHSRRIAGARQGGVSAILVVHAPLAGYCDCWVSATIAAVNASRYEAPPLSKFVVVM